MNRKLLMGIVLSFLSGASIDAVCGMESDRPNENNPSQSVMRAQKEMRSKVTNTEENKNFDPRYILKESRLFANHALKSMKEEFDIKNYTFYIAPNDMDAFIPIHSVINYISCKISSEYSKSCYKCNKEEIIYKLRGTKCFPSKWGEVKLNSRELPLWSFYREPDDEIYFKALSYIYTAYLYNYCNNNDAFENPVAFRNFINKCSDNDGVLNGKNILDKLYEYGCLILNERIVTKNMNENTALIFKKMSAILSKVQYNWALEGMNFDEFKKDFIECMNIEESQENISVFFDMALIRHDFRTKERIAAYIYLKSAINSGDRVFFRMYLNIKRYNDIYYKKKVELLNNVLAIDQMSNYVYNFDIYYRECLGSHLDRYYCCFRNGVFDDNLNKVYEAVEHIDNLPFTFRRMSFEEFADYVNQCGRDRIIEILCKRGCIQRRGEL